MKKEQHIGNGHLHLPELRRPDSRRFKTLPGVRRKGLSPDAIRQTQAPVEEFGLVDLEKTAAVTESQVDADFYSKWLVKRPFFCRRCDKRLEAGDHLTVVRPTTGNRFQRASTLIIHSSCYV